MTRPLETRPLEAWDQYLCALKSELPELVYQAWFEPLVAAGDDDHHLCLACPSDFHLNRIRERYLPAIEREMSGRCEDGCRVELSVDPSARAKSEQQERATRPTRERENAQSAPMRVRDISNRHAVTFEEASTVPPSFRTFVVGSANALAREASFALAKGRQIAMSPLCLVSEPGLGKSHLASAIVREARADGRTRALLVSAEQFTSELTRAIQKKTTAEFKRRYRDDLDLLILEDIEFVEGKRATQIELFHTLDAFRRSGSRIVLTAAKAPRELPGLDPRLASRMSGGLCVEIEEPERELRYQILREKAAHGGFRIPEPCLDYLASCRYKSIRELESALVKLLASSALLGKEMDVPLAKQALTSVQAERPKRLDATDVALLVANFFGTTLEALGDPSRRGDLLWPRQLAMYLCHRYTSASTKAIGILFRRGHSAVRNAVKSVEQKIFDKPHLRYQVEALSERLAPVVTQLDDGDDARDDSAGKSGTEGGETGPDSPS